MAGLDPAIHALAARENQRWLDFRTGNSLDSFHYRGQRRVVDGRDEPGHDVHVTKRVMDNGRALARRVHHNGDGRRAASSPRASMRGLRFWRIVAREGFAARATMPQTKAISATVTGNDEQVGFRALVMKQAIELNLAGAARNEPNNIVKVTLQGDVQRLDSAIATIRQGTRRSSNIEVSTSQAAVDPSLRAFTIVDWTSSSRGITNPYTLVFKLRDNDQVISDSEAKGVWRQILRTTLKGEDLQKLRPED